MAQVPAERPMRAMEEPGVRAEAGSSPERLQHAHAASFGDLSQFFNAFLPRFVRDSLAGGGEVWVTRSPRGPDGLLLYHEVERMASIFTRSRARADELRLLRPSAAVFCEFPLTPAIEVYSVWETHPAAAPLRHRYRHPVRSVRPSDWPEVGRMLREAYGRFDPRWLAVAALTGSRCLVAEVGGQIAGVAWISVVGHEARLYSLTVAPRFRRIGVATDLWHARMEWARRAGATRVISEISELNAASIQISERGGMRRIGALYLSRTPKDPQVSGAPQLGQTLSVTSMRLPQ